MNPPSVVVLNPAGRDAWGGVEKDMLVLAEGLVARGGTAIAAGRRGGRFLAGFAAAGIPTVPLSLRSDVAPIDALRLSRAARRIGAEVIATKLSRGVRTAALARVLGAGAAIVQHHGLYEIRPGPRYRWTLNRVSRILTPARSIRDRIAAAGAFPADRIDWVPNGVDGRRFRPDPAARAAIRARRGIPDGPLLVNLARLHDQKCHEVMIDVLAALPATVRLAFAGEGKRSAALRERAERAGVGPRVHFLGHLDAPEELLRAADLFLLPSREEGMPNSVLEAMATGLPVVASAVGDVPAMLAGTGVLVPPGDAAATTAAVAALLADSLRAAALGRAARERAVAVYPVERMVEAGVACYSRAAEDFGRSAKKSPSPMSPSAPPARKLAE